MHLSVAQHRNAIAALCRRFGVAQLDVFGSAARGFDFRETGSDADFLVTFAPAARNDVTVFLDFKQALEAELGRPVDLVERDALEASRNHIRRTQILREAEAVYG
jgi:uncharacterized protein